MSLGGAGGGSDLRVFFAGGFDFGGVSDSAEAACRRSVPFIAAGDSVRCESMRSPPPPGFGENMADAVIDIGGVGDPNDRLRRKGESRGGAVPLGFGEKMADAIIGTGDWASPDKIECGIFPIEPAKWERYGCVRPWGRGGVRSDQAFEPWDRRKLDVPTTCVFGGEITSALHSLRYKPFIHQQVVCTPHKLHAYLGDQRPGMALLYSGEGITGGYSVGVRPSRSRKSCMCGVIHDVMLQ